MCIIQEREIPKIIGDFEIMAQAQKSAQKIIKRLSRFQAMESWIARIIKQLDSDNIAQLEQIKLILENALSSKSNIDKSNPIYEVLKKCLKEVQNEIEGVH